MPPSDIDGVTVETARVVSQHSRWRVDRVLMETTLGLAAVMSSVGDGDDGSPPPLFVGKFSAIRYGGMDGGVKQDPRRECVLLSECDHPNVITLTDVILYRPQGWAVDVVCTVTPYMFPGDVFELLARPVSFERHCTRSFRHRFFVDVCAALTYLHAEGIAHLDVSLENVLLGIDGVFRLTDFGFSVRTSMLRSPSLVPSVGKIDYQAPELGVVSYPSYPLFPADVYSFGVCLYRLQSRMRFPVESDGPYAGSLSPYWRSRPLITEMRTPFISSCPRTERRRRRGRSDERDSLHRHSV